MKRSGAIGLVVTAFASGFFCGWWSKTKTMDKTSQEVARLEVRAQEINRKDDDDLDKDFLSQFGAVPIQPPETQINQWKLKADQGDIDACLNLAYTSGLDSATGAYWYQRASERGSAIGERELARLYLRGKAVPQDVLRAKALYESAAKQGDMESQVALLRLTGSTK